MIANLIISHIPFGNFHVYKILNTEYVQIGFVVVVLVIILNFIKDAIQVNLE